MVVKWREIAFLTFQSASLHLCISAYLSLSLSLFLSLSLSHCLIVFAITAHIVVPSTENLFSNYMEAGEVTPGVQGDASRGEVITTMATSFVHLAAIYFPSVTGKHQYHLKSFIRCAAVVWAFSSNHFLQVQVQVYKYSMHDV